MERLSVGLPSDLTQKALVTLNIGQWMDVNIISMIEPQFTTSGDSFGKGRQRRGPRQT